MPPVFGINAPKCPRCGKSVYIAEQVIGPNSTPYHKPCLACITCNKRLDSTLLVEHDGLPLCKNCHRNHLGQGKGGFGKAVPVKANLPVSPDRKKEADRDDGDDEDEDEMVRRLTGISVRSRGGEANAPPSSSSSSSPPASATSPTSPRSLPTRPPNPTPAHAAAAADAPVASSPPTQRAPASHISSLDDLVSSSGDIPRIQPRSEEMRREVDDLYRSVGNGNGGGGDDEDAAPHRAPLPATRGPATRAPPSRVPATPPPPKPASMQATQPQQPPPLPTTPTSAAGLPAPVRRTPASASASSSYKMAPPPSVSTAFSPSSPSSSPARLASSIASGTPLCARCSRPVYHAEQVVAATGNRVWHRPCLRCDVCATTLQKGQLEEGPAGGAVAVDPATPSTPTTPPLAPNNPTACNVYCRVCYKKWFGPRGIGAAGMSFAR